MKSKYKKNIEAPNMTVTTVQLIPMTCEIRKILLKKHNIQKLKFVDTNPNHNWYAATENQ